MMKMVVALLAMLFAAHSGQSASTAGETPRVPVLLELFTSEGCSSCPPADKLLEMLDRGQPAAGADLIVLSEHVDYWNHLGWSDPFSSPVFTARQRRYAALFKNDDVYTPQLVVDGSRALVGSNRGEALDAIRQAQRQPKLGIAITATRSGDTAMVHIEAPPETHGTELYLVLASDHARSQVERGENAGHALTHVSVAYKLERVSSAGGDLHVHLKDGGGRVIAFLQDRASGRVLAVAQARL